MTRRVALGGLLGALIGCGRRPQPSAAGPQLSNAIAAIGDSLAMGLGASAQQDGFIFKSVTEAARADHRSVRLYSVACVGATVADTRRLEVPRLVERGADVVIVCVGGNDLLNQNDPADFATSYDSLLGSLHLNARTIIITCGVPDVFVSIKLDHDQAAAAHYLVGAYNHTIASLSRAHRARFVDFAGLDVAGALASDGFHPSTMGYRRMAERLVPVLRRVLQ